MLLGIMADTHDNQPMTKKAVELFNSKNIDYMIHAGDFTSPFTVKLFRDIKCKYTGVFGNNDGDKLLLQDRSEGSIKNQPLILKLDNRKMVVVHEHQTVDALADSGHFDVVIYGHTHEPVMKRIKDALLINPGEVCGWLYGKSTVALLDLNTMNAEIVRL
ncbi:MAG: metallophosphoesterase [Nitrospirae bacterium]|nr:metallophosphoesterase [Nitrospirota bacterium]